MWPSRRQLAADLKSKLKHFSQVNRPLPGVASPAALDALTMQIVASTRRLDHTELLRNRPVAAERTDPNSAIFDPERAAIWHLQSRNLDEAVWLTFLSIHVGKRRTDGWRRLRDIYSGLGGERWSWDRVSANPEEFQTWLRANRLSIGGGFGNHRKYESLDADSAQGTAAVVASYVDWVGPAHSHQAKFAALIQGSGNNPETIFHAFYEDFAVRRFGRLGKFDFLALVGRLHLAPIRPGSAYLHGATGPLRGARLLFGGSTSSPFGPDVLDGWLKELDAALGVGMQVLEDSICNWQKSPNAFIHFRG